MTIDPKRLDLMSNGVEELETWLLDMLREGTALLEQAPADYWEELSARMVNAKLGSIARRIRAFPTLLKSVDGPEKMTAELAGLLLFVRAFRRMDAWPPARQMDLLITGGVNLKKNRAREGKALKDHWLVIGQQSGEEEKLRFRRTWLLGEQTAKTGLLLDFAWGRNDFTEHWITGSVFKGEIVFYPSNFPLRCLVKSFAWSTEAFMSPAGYATFLEMQIAYTQALEANPWLYAFPCLISQAWPIFSDGAWLLLDGKHKQIPLSGESAGLWKSLALSGGRAIRVFGEWNGTSFHPLSIIEEQRIVQLNP